MNMFEKPQKNESQSKNNLEILDHEINIFEEEIEKINKKISDIQSEINEFKNNSEIIDEMEHLRMMETFMMSKMNQKSDELKIRFTEYSKNIDKLFFDFENSLHETGLPAKKIELENQRDPIYEKKSELEIEKDTLLFNEEKNTELDFLEKEHSKLETKNNRYNKVKNELVIDITEKIKEFTDYGMSKSAAIETFRKRENEKEWSERKHLKTDLLYNLNEIIPILENHILDIEIKQESLDNMKREGYRSRNTIKNSRRELTDENMLRNIFLLEKSLETYDL